ncbi:bifunctional phosphoribosyl-AMP cyclohydrolase/phosphoribosyl-ATP diphosphatase HisIE [soil metagenome]
MALVFDERGLVPVIVQDELTGEIRMLAWADAAALNATAATGKATFFSRSRHRLWVKGETSGNTIAVARVLVDCDEDAVLYVGRPAGPSCHTGAASCFFRDSSGEATAPAPFLLRLEQVLEERKIETAKASYVKSLYDGGPARIGEKLREEAAELGHALANESDERVAEEAADLRFHAMVGLRARSVPLADVLAVLARRFGTSGHVEKASRG